MKKGTLKGYIISIGIPLLIGGISALLTGSSMQTFSALNQPPLSPPAWLFPTVWCILYILMGIASYRIYRIGAMQDSRQSLLTLYGIQLFFNFMWSLVFFNLQWYLFAFIWLLILWVMIIVMMLRFYRLDVPSGRMILPYVLWVTFAAYLNFGIYLLNR